MVKLMLKTAVLECLAAMFFLALFANQAHADGKMFMEKKCTKCHAISAYNIEKKETKDDADDEDDDDSEKVDPPDLSNVGNQHDAAFLTPFLKKEIEHKPHPGCDSKKKHKVKFKGSDEEFKQMVDWLLTLKKEPTK